MKHVFHIRSNEKGSTLLISILILLLLTVIGIAATNTSTIEILISGNDKVHKMAFHQADGGTEVGIEFVEKANLIAGFNSTSPDNNLKNVGAIKGENSYIMNPIPSRPSDSNRDVYLPKNYIGHEPHTNLTIGGNPELSTGSGIQMAAGYEGIGKGAAGGGAKKVYDIWSQHIGVANSEAMILLQWMHIM
jgi:hypothetical protein